MNFELETLKLEGGEFRTTLSEKYRKRKPYSLSKPIIKAAIPGIIMEVLVKEGQQVKRGDAICVLDSMKMNNTICSSYNGVVSKIYITVGQMVGKDTPLVEIK